MNNIIADLKKNKKIWIMLIIFISIFVINKNLIFGEFYVYNAKDLQTNSEIQGEDVVNGKEPGAQTYGPYQKIKQGNYTIDIYYNTNVNSNSYDVFSNNKGILYSGQLKNNADKISFDIQVREQIEDLEVRTFFNGEGYLHINKIQIRSLGMDIKNQLIISCIYLISILIIVKLIPNNSKIEGVLFVSLAILILKKVLMLDSLSLCMSGICFVLLLLLLRKKYLEDKDILFLGVLIGMMIFFILLGIKIIKPTYIEWLLGRGGDPTQHFLGWNFYRSSRIQWPITFMENYGYPDGTLIGFTDSIPLFAIPLRFINNILPTKFQFIGGFIFICYILQGLFSAKIASQISKNKYVICCISILFSTSSIMLWRAYGHEALMAHWVLLWGIYIYITYNKEDNYWQWLILFPLAILIHPYFVPMLYFLYTLFLITFYKEYKKFNWRKFVATNVCIVLTMFICGYLKGGNGDNGGYGFYSFNLNSFFNPESWSTIFRGRPLGAGQYEGINYLGAGILILFIILILTKNITINNFKNKKLEITISALLLVFAASNIVTFDNTIIFKYPLPPIYRKITTVFRSSGRMAWPLYYLIICYLLKISAKNYKGKRIIVLFSCITLLQLYDYKDKFYEIKNLYTINYKWETKLTDNKWNEVVKDYNCLKLTINNDDYVYFAMLASDNKINLNTGSFASISNTDSQEGNLCLKAQNEIYNDILDKDSIYVLLDDSTKKFAEERYLDYLIEMNGYSVLCPKGVD